MTKYQFDSYDEFIKAVAESKAEYRAQYRNLSYKEKIRQIVRLQQKAYLLGRMKFKPWPIDDNRHD
jgi:hypothetical protein